MVEQLAHGLRRRALLADVAEPLDIFGRERVLQEEQLELLHVLGKTHRLNRVQPLVDVVQQFHLKAQFCADVFKHPQVVHHVLFAVVIRAFGRALGLDQGRCLAAVAAHLAADVAIALLLELADAIDDGLGRIATRVAVHSRTFAALAAQ